MPSANITRLARAQVTTTNYFVDTNVWIYAIEGDGLLAPWQRRYSDFFYDIIDSLVDPQPKILMPTLLFSEILNTYLKQIALEEYKTINGIPKGTSLNFKNDYRPTQHYKESYEKVCDDIYGLRTSLIFIGDQSVLTDPPLYLNPAIAPFDFNDYFYYQICKEFQKEKSITILTHDADFQITDIPIITANWSLLS
jgi:hypothetical protein